MPGPVQVADVVERDVAVVQAAPAEALPHVDERLAGQARGGGEVAEEGRPFRGR
jgi:hypothetical protein